MVAEDPVRMNSYQRFCLYHEVGHISGVQSEIQDRVFLNQTQGFILVLVIAIVTQGSPLAVLSSAFFYWLWNSIAKDITQNKEIDYEILADTYALYMMASDNNFHSISTSFSDYIQSLKDTNNELLQRRINTFNTHKEHIENLRPMIMIMDDRAELAIVV